jgi:hypothetical protein
MRLQQGQLWRTKSGFIRITHLERFGVEYKKIANLEDGAGEHLEATKKEFCRLLKGGTLLEPKPEDPTPPEA